MIALILVHVAIANDSNPPNHRFRMVAGKYVVSVS